MQPSTLSRAYPRNSPQAAGRIIAMSLISNGEIKAAEWSMLCKTQARTQIGLTGPERHAIVDGLCQDLLDAARTMRRPLTRRRQETTAVPAAKNQESPVASHRRPPGFSLCEQRRARLPDRRMTAGQNRCMHLSPSLPPCC